MCSKITGTVLFLLLVFLSTTSTSQNNHYITSELSVLVKGGVLNGTLFAPANIKKPPVVLIIAGSGPTDRNGNSTMLAGKNNSLLLLADSLAAHGIASLRYDKRGVGKSQLKGMREDSLLFDDMINDAQAWLTLLREKRFKKIFIAGHSEGSLIGMALAVKEKVTGYISLAGAGRRIDKILKEQLATLPDSLRVQSYLYLDTLANGNKLANPDKRLYSIFRPSVQPYMISWIKYNPATLIASITCPILIVQGKKDIQVKTEDAVELHNAKPSSKLVLIENMNHIFKEIFSDNPTENQKSYNRSDLPVMSSLVTSIVKFIQSPKK